MTTGYGRPLSPMAGTAGTRLTPAAIPWRSAPTVSLFTWPPAGRWTGLGSSCTSVTYLFVCAPRPEPTRMWLTEARGRTCWTGAVTDATRTAPGSSGADVPGNTLPPVPGHCVMKSAPTAGRVRNVLPRSLPVPTRTHRPCFRRPCFRRPVPGPDPEQQARLRPLR